MDVLGREDPTGTKLPSGTWWLLLLAGIGWIVVSFVILAFKPSSVLTISYLVGFVLILGGVNELVALKLTPGWEWLRIALGVLFILAGILALIEPLQTFGILALLIGWYLLFKGTFEVIASIADRDEIPLWGLLLGTGILEMALGAWALGYPGRSAWLLVIWVGLGALIRGIGEIVMAFKVRDPGGPSHAIA